MLAIGKWQMPIFKFHSVGRINLYSKIMGWGLSEPPIIIYLTSFKFDVNVEYLRFNLTCDSLIIHVKCKMKPDIKSNKALVL